MQIGKPPLGNTAERVLLARRHLNLNLKWHNLYGRLLSYQRLYEAWRKVKANQGCAVALLGQQMTQLDAYVRQRIRRCRLPQRGRSKT